MQVEYHSTIGTFWNASLEQAVRSVERSPSTSSMETSEPAHCIPHHAHTGENCSPPGHVHNMDAEQQVLPAQKISATENV
jgi:hypothetical protein